MLIRSAPKLVLPYTAPVLRALVGKLRAAGSSSAAAASAAVAQPNIKAPSQGGCGTPYWAALVADTPRCTGHRSAAHASTLLAHQQCCTHLPPCPLPAEEGFEVAVLMTLGELATVAGAQLRADVPEILPLVIDAIQDGGSPTKRLVAVGTLGQVRGGAAVCMDSCLGLGWVAAALCWLGPML